MSKPNCLTCGLCCCAPAGQDAFCDVTADDLKKIDKKFRLKVWKPSSFDRLAAALSSEELPFGALRTKILGPVTACVALEGDVGKKVKCAIYRTRPETCKTAVVPGDRACRGIRRTNKELLHAS